MNAQILLVFCIGEKGQGRLVASISKGKPDVFSGELCFRQPINFMDAADLLGGKFVYPKDIEEHGFMINQHVEEKAFLWYKNSDGSFGIHIKFSNVYVWNGKYGLGCFSVNSIRGIVEYLGRDSGDYRISLEGNFQLDEYNAALSVSLAMGGTDIPTVIALSFKKDIGLPGFIDSVSGVNDYESLPLPEAYAKPESAFGMAAVLNLTEQTFFLSGKYRAKSGAAASLLLYFSKQEEGYAWLMAAQLANFSLSDISSALEDADRFLGLDNVTATMILSNMEQEISGLREVLPVSDIGSVQKGLTFQIELELSDGFLKEALDIQGSCKLAGYIPKDKDKAITLSGHTDKVVFLQFLELTEIGIYLEKNSGDGFFSFSLKGNVGFAFPELKLSDIRAEITVEENKTDKKVILKGEVGEPIENPLGIPDTTLEQLIFYAISQKSIPNGKVQAGDKAQTTEQIYLQGGVEIADILLRARIYFVQRRPAVVDIMIDGNQKLSISAFVSKYFNFAWPDILDIQLYDGRIWYCSEEAVLDGVVYNAGFHARVNTRLFFFPEFTFFIDIDNKDELKTGVRINNAVELAFLKFYTKEANVECGPEVSLEITGHEAAFNLSTYVSIFSEEIGEVGISVKKERMEGIFRFPAYLPISGEIKFFIDDKGVSMEEFQIGQFKEMDFKLPKMEFGDGKCKIKVLSEPKIKTVPEVESKDFIMDEQRLGIIFDVTIRIKSETSFSQDGGDDVVTLPFKDLSLEVNKNDISSLTFDSFMEILGENIVDIVDKMFEQVINGEVFNDVLTEEGMKKLVKFLTIEGVSWGINELISYLVCQGLKKALADALVSALTGIGQTMWEGLGYLLMLGGLFGVVINGIYTAGKRVPDRNDDEPEKNPATPDLPEVIFQEEKLVIRWNACDRADGYYPIVSRLLTGQQEQNQTINLVLGVCKDTTYEIAGSDEESLYQASYGFEYRIKIYAWNDDGAATSEESAIYLLQRPKGLKVRYLCEKKSLYITWDKVERAGEYEVERLWYEQGVEKRETLTYAADTNEAFYDNIEPDQGIGIFVRGKAENVIGPGISIESFYLYDLQAPSDVQGYGTDDGIALEWKQVLYADRYRISCFDDSGREISVPESCETQTIICADYLQENVCYTMRIQSATEEIEGRISEEIRVLWRQLPIPEILEVICGEDGLLLFVLAADNVKYRQIVYPDGRVILLDEQQMACEWDIGENARVRIIERARQGKWSREISLKPMQTPQDMKISLQGEVLRVEWKDMGEEFVYGIEILAGDYHQKEELFEGTLWQTDISTLPDDGNGFIRVCLYAIDREDTRRRSDSAECSIDRYNSCDII